MFNNDFIDVSATIQLEASEMRSDILLVAEKLSFIKDISIEEVIEQTTKNALDLFKLSR